MDLAIADRYNISYDLVWFNRQAFEAEFNSLTSGLDVQDWKTTDANGKSKTISLNFFDNQIWMSKTGRQYTLDANGRPKSNIIFLYC